MSSEFDHHLMDEVESGQLEGKNNFESVLRCLSGRQTVLTDIYRHAMETEFWPSQISCQDWKDTLSWLAKSTEQIRRLCDLRPEESKQFSTKHFAQDGSLEKWCELYENAIERAVDTLVTSSGLKSPQYSKLIVNAIEEVRLGLRLSRSLQSVFAVDGESIDLPHALAGIEWAQREKYSENLQLVEDLYSHEISKAKRAGNPADLKEIDPDIDRCMISRRLYLIACYYAYSFPFEWQRNHHLDTFDSIHSQFLDTMEHGTPFWKSVMKRKANAVRLSSRLTNEPKPEAA